MIRITKQTDYGIVLLSHMAGEPGHLFTAPDLAAEAGLPLPMVSKVLKVLAREGLLVSQRGVKGGYGLARGADEITVEEAIRVLEGPIAITECIEVEGDCDHEAGCPTRSNWWRINEAVRSALAGLTLADMIQPLPAAPKLVSIGGR